MQNILVANKINLKSIKNISHDWSVAKQTLEHLRAHNISYIALVMDEHDNLLVYKGKGRPTREESEEILANGDLKQQLAEVRADLKLSGYGLDREVDLGGIPQSGVACFLLSDVPQT